jgi:MFS family permease
VEDERNTTELERLPLETLSIDSEDHQRWSQSEHVYYQFVRFSICCAAVPACALACLALATAQLGTIGARQSGILYATYTFFSLIGATTLLIQKIGSHGAIVVGQLLFGGYIALFWMASMLVHTSKRSAEISAWLGAGLGGIGASMFWTAQGVYFAEATQVYCEQSGRTIEESTSLLAGVFAFSFLVEETLVDVLATVLVKAGVPWTLVFLLYTILTIIATILTTAVPIYPRHDLESRQSTGCSKALGTVNLLITDSRTKYMIGFNAAFGFAGAYLNSFISGQVVPKVYHDSSFVGVLVAIHGITAALVSLCYSRMTSKAPALFLGSLAFAFVAVPFFVEPDVENNWGWGHVLFIYSIHGVGRAAFEGPFKAVFADLFPRDTDAAFTNITLQNGLAGSVAYILMSRLACVPSTTSAGSFCVAYQDGTYHDIGLLGCIVIGTSVASILGFARVLSLSQRDSHTMVKGTDRLAYGSDLYSQDVLVHELQEREDNGVHRLD